MSAAAYQALVDRFKGEICDLDSLAKRIKRAWRFAQSSPAEQDMFLDSVALGLHGFYSGLESLFVQVARHLDGNMPEGEGWHAALIAVKGSRDCRDISAGVSGVWVCIVKRVRTGYSQIEVSGNSAGSNGNPDSMNDLLESENE